MASVPSSRTIPRQTDIQGNYFSKVLSGAICPSLMVCPLFERKKADRGGPPFVLALLCAYPNTVRNALSVAVTIWSMSSFVAISAGE
jgi:hypothetical protein